MIILTNCLAEKNDEGCLKVAGSLIRRQKTQEPNTMVISYGESSQGADLHLPVNKWMISPRLWLLLWRRKEPLLYIPAVAKGHAMAIRIFILSLFCRRGLRVVVAMQHSLSPFWSFWLKCSGAELFALSRESWKYYADRIGNCASYLKTGVDTRRFTPVEPEKKLQLREKYGIPREKMVVLHVGHLKAGRNVGQLLNLDDRFHGILVASSYASEQKDAQLRRQITEKENLTLMDTYLPNIEEIYQLSDVYLFPVVAEHNCIDVPLSAMEAAACGIPVVATSFGELKELLMEEGFYEITSFEPESLNSLLAKAAKEQKNPRDSVLEYDWNQSVRKLFMNSEKIGGNRK